MTNFEIHPVSVAAILDLRHRVLRPGRSFETAKFPGDEAPTAIHLAAFDGETVVGCGTLMENTHDGQPALQLRGMAVDPAWQHRGVGRQILQAVESIAAQRGIRLLWANARKSALAFYTDNGWTVASEEFDIPLVGPHFKIVRNMA